MISIRMLKLENCAQCVKIKKKWTEWIPKKNHRRNSVIEIRLVSNDICMQKSEKNSTWKMYAILTFASIICNISSNVRKRHFAKRKSYVSFIFFVVLFFFILLFRYRILCLGVFFEAEFDELFQKMFLYFGFLLRF